MGHEIVDIYLFMEFQVIFLILQLQKLQQSWEMLVLYPWKVGKKYWRVKDLTPVS